MKKIAILILCLVLTCGCMSVTSIIPTRSYHKSYELKEIYTTDTGSTMLTIYNAYIYPGYRPVYTYSPPPWRSYEAKMPPITPDQKWRAIFKYKENYIINSDGYSKNVGIEIKPNGELGNKKAWIDITLKSNILRSHISWELPEPKLFESEDYIIEAHKDSFKAELLYNGKMNDIIIVSYREYINNMARPAFFQELKYDLKEGNDITFKSLKIKVLEATNSKISFQILDDGGLPWVQKLTPFL